MDIRYSHHHEDVKHYDTETLRRHFLITDLFTPGEAKLTYSHYDRIIVGGIMPTDKPVPLEAGKAIASEYFLERREMGVINIGGPGFITLDGTKYELSNSDGIYVGKGVKEIQFESKEAGQPAKFYMNSGTAHESYPTTLISLEKANKVHLGSELECNKRTINQYVHPAVCKSCQLVMGMTILEPGSIWNTLPCHTHDRRMEVYLYFNMNDNVVFHLMGEPQETRHLVVRNEEAVISPSWSIHSGVGSANYTFIWGMVGENQTFTDMDAIKTCDLR